MNIQDIQLIIPNFNQLTYTRNLINWWKWYYPNNPVVILDNNSTYEPLKKWYLQAEAKVYFYPNNDFIGNLNQYLSENKPEYYCISDPDIMPHPATPPNFLEIFKSILDSGFHHVGFDLITSDIPEWNKKAGWIQGDEAALHHREQRFEYDGKVYTGFKAPIDTTFALYSRNNSGWQAPMPPAHWDNSIRIFNAHHLTWYLDKNHLNDEMKHYFATCLTRDDSQPSAGRNHFRPE